MAHTTRDKEKLLVRVRRIRGQVEALEKALDQDDDCSKVLHLIAGSRGAMDGLMAEVLEGHIRSHVADPKAKASERTQATEVVIELIRSYLR
jgi:DNA-binding FrmR family transcriptional regulator